LGVPSDERSTFPAGHLGIRDEYNVEKICPRSSMKKDLLQLMRDDWNARACENARHYVQTGGGDWSDYDFFRSGEMSVANEVIPDMPRICGDRSPLDVRMLELGCGVGRMTRALARVFGHVTGVDISDEMIRQAKRGLSDLANVTLEVVDGSTLASLKDEQFDFAFSFIVFQHIPSYDVITSLCKEVFRVLRPGSLFKFQVQGGTTDEREANTWVGVSFSGEDTSRLARAAGFRIELSLGAGTQYYWLWFRKP
jgi:SAM-dependent methyltransferase